MTRHLPPLAAMIVLTLGTITTLAGAEPTVTPPVAKRVEHRETRHGEMVIDDYHWLREKSNPEVIAYLEAENAYTEALTKDLKPFAEAVYREIRGRLKEADLSVPARRGGYYYYSRTVDGQQYPIRCRRRGSMEAPEEVLLDMNALAQGRRFVALGAFAVSDDGNLLAYTTDTTGYRQYVLSVKDLRTGESLPDTIQRVTSVQWAADNKTLLLTTEDAVTKRSSQLWRHTLGADKSELVYTEPDELFVVRVHRTRDRKFVVLQINSQDTSEVRYLAADAPAVDLCVFAAREKGHRYRVEHREGVFYISTNKGAKNFQVVTTPVKHHDPTHWQVLIGHQADVLVRGMDVFKDFVVVLERSNALDTIRILDSRTGEWHQVTFPEPAYATFSDFDPQPANAMFSGFDAEYDEPVYRYNYQSPVTPPSVFDYDTRSQQSTLVKQQEVLGGYDPRGYVTERLWATARDGVKVPLTIVYKQGFRRDGSRALLLYGYGSYGAGLPASFSSERVSLLDRGMAFCIAHVRGGNELGETWRDGGMLMSKKNTFNDFVDSAEYLIREKWTSPERLAIQGASAGGLLMGAVVNMRPDLFRAVHAGVPFVDVMNTMFDASLPLTVEEYLVWGNPHERAAYDYMRSYSPYDNLQRRAYPAMLVTPSLNDSQVMYWEPAKYVARMRSLKTDTHPLLLKTNMGAGHGGSSGRFDRLQEQAFQYAWLMSQVGIANR